MSGRARRRLTECVAALDALDLVAARTDRLGVRVPEISRWSIGQQVEHLASANGLCLGAAAILLAGGDERIVASGAPTLLGRLVLIGGWIPRGKGRAPEATVPESEPDPACVAESLRRGRRALDDLRRDPAALAAAPGRVPHPVLGCFDAIQWVRFTVVHVRHHLRIVDELNQRATDPDKG